MTDNDATPSAGGTPGWYPQPDGSRWYWDGEKYTEHVTAGEFAAEEKRRRTWNRATLVVAGGLVLGAAVVALLVHKSPEDKASDACHDYMEARLKAPATADFSDEWATEVSSGGFKAYGTVDSENGFGAKVRLTFTCDVTSDYTVSDLHTSED